MVAGVGRRHRHGGLVFVAMLPCERKLDLEIVLGLRHQFLLMMRSHTPLNLLFEYNRLLVGPSVPAVSAITLRTCRGRSERVAALVQSGLRPAAGRPLEFAPRSRRSAPIPPRRKPR